MSGHTPTPWRVFDGGEYHGIEADGQTVVIYGTRLDRDDGGVRGDTPAEGCANAAFIVRAVNAHDDLVAALKGLDAYWLQDFPGGPDDPTNTVNDFTRAVGGRLADETIVMWKNIRAALAKAEDRS